LLEKYFTPQYLEFVFEEPVSNIQAKLDELFNRSFVEDLFDSNLNLSGNFTNSEKTSFKITRAIGPYMSGATPKYYCKISKFEENKTLITIIDETRATTILGFIIVSTLFLPILLFFTYFRIISFLQFIGFCLALIAFFILIIKLSKSFYKNGLLRDFEKMLRSK
jgi:hypothetical protein